MWIFNLFFYLVFVCKCNWQVYLSVNRWKMEIRICPQLDRLQHSSCVMYVLLSLACCYPFLCFFCVLNGWKLTWFLCDRTETIYVTLFTVISNWVSVACLGCFSCANCNTDKFNILNIVMVEVERDIVARIRKKQ